SIGFIFCLLQIGNAQKNTINDLDNILKEIETDTIAKIERLAAFEFHHLLNNYRKQQRKQALDFDEIIWIAARNHNLYMKAAGDLTHRENMNQTNLSQFTTGNYPSERVDFAAADKEVYISSGGENCLYNYSFYGNNYVEIAKNMALTAFNQWKSSKGHHENMLTTNYKKHGIAFTYDQGTVWATNVFSRGIFYKGNEVVADTKVPVPTSTNKIAEKPKRIHIYKVKNELQHTLEQQILASTSSKTSKKLNEQASIAARKLAYNKKLKAESDDPVLLNKLQTHTATKWWGLIKKQISVYCLVLETSPEAFDLEKIQQEIQHYLLENQPFTQKKKRGTGIMVSKRKNILRITLVSMAV
ncbi:MAG: CAP domain-containing protein, partial [Flavobacteriales bacterium]|nr:CAP domain-containing protein [Flavobacteriales bacterium]